MRKPFFGGFPNDRDDDDDDDDGSDDYDSGVGDDDYDDFYLGKLFGEGGRPNPLVISGKEKSSILSFQDYYHQ